MAAITTALAARPTMSQIRRTGVGRTIDVGKMTLGAAPDKEGQVARAGVVGVAQVADQVTWVARAGVVGVAQAADRVLAALAAMVAAAPAAPLAGSAVVASVAESPARAWEGLAAVGSPVRVGSPPAALGSAVVAASAADNRAVRGSPATMGRRWPARDKAAGPLVLT